MFRAIPVINKACADRVRQKEHELHKERIKSVRSQVDTVAPSVMHLDHLRNNLKREQMLEERYHAIDRENRILLTKMSDMMKTPTLSASRARSSVSLNRDNRKQELSRITRENKEILRRIQHTQPVYSTTALEDSFRKSHKYLLNKTEYPLVLNRKTSPVGSMVPASPMSSLGQSKSATALGADGKPGQPADDLKYVFKEGRKLAKKYYLVEMATDGRILAISAYEGDQQRTLELVVNEQNHRKLYREFHGDYSLIADRLHVEGDKLRVKLGGGPLSPKSIMAKTV